MRHPLWIVNSAVLLLVLLALCFIYLSGVRVPQREDIEPVVRHRPRHERVLEVNIKKIYEDDLFNTHKKRLSIPTETDLSIPFPEPPSPVPTTIPTTPPPQFLDPLDITLRGIIVVGSDHAKNSVIIEDNKTKQEVTYHVGDVFEDATLIRILSNKVIFLRSNGQQEVLYLREQDAQYDPTYMAISDWEPVAQQLTQSTLAVNPKEFTERIQSLAQFIDMLGLTTVYKQGKSVGCRIGQLSEKSLGKQLGLQTGDIIVSIDNIPATDNNYRMKIYHHIVDKCRKEITVRLLRSGKELILTYLLRDFEPEKESDSKIVEHTEDSLQKLKEDEKINILKEKYKFAPTLRDIQSRERQNMFKHGRSQNAHMRRSSK